LPKNVSTLPLPESACPSCASSSGLKSNVSRWLTPPAAKMFTTRFARGAKWTSPRASIQERATAPRPPPTWRRKWRRVKGASSHMEELRRVEERPADGRQAVLLRHRDRARGLGVGRLPSEREPGRAPDRFREIAVRLPLH